MTTELNWLYTDPQNVLKIEFQAHHAPVYLTTIDTGQILDYEYPIDTPSVPDEDITVAVQDKSSVQRQLGNAVDIEKVTIENSPYTENLSDKIIPQGSVILYKRDNRKQYIVELPNAEFVVFDENTQEYFSVHPKKVRDKIDSPQEPTQRVPVSATPIPRDPLREHVR